jgi:hypothetical protein
MKATFALLAVAFAAFVDPAASQAQTAPLSPRKPGFLS